MIYELLAGALSSYLLGESVTQFSLIIGVYLFAMGIGSFLSKSLESNLVERFIDIEILIGIVGGFSSAILFLSFSLSNSFRIPLFFIVVVVGILVGLEIPILLRILKKHVVFKELVSKVLALDYVGALFASILFPLFLIPKLGLVRTSFLFGLLNISVALWTTWVLPVSNRALYSLRAKSIFAITILTIGLIFSDHITEFSEESLYADEIILAKSSQFQRIVLTRWKDEMRLFLNGHLQFSTRDEYRYHEALVHPAMSGHKNPENILVLGGGDGMAVREILKYKTVKKISLVDLDPVMTDLFKSNDLLKQFNQHSLSDKKVQLINADAFNWLEKNQNYYDVVIVDFPDPSNYSIGKLYSTTFYKLLKKNLNLESVVSVQSTSPLFARKSFWCINKTIQSAGIKTKAFHVYVPSFGEWGFVLAGNTNFLDPKRIPKDLKFLKEEEYFRLFQFAKDMEEVDTEINRLDNQVLVRYYDEEWKQITPY